jgi:hypothetical protein
VVTLALSVTLGAIGILCLGSAVVNERRMQRHRQPGVTYVQVTWRRDGGWKRADLFTDKGLAYQRKASTWGVIGAALLLVAVVANAVASR